MERTVNGSCMCGDVKFRISGEAGIFQYCFCNRCRKMYGTAHASNLLVKPEQLEWLQGEETITRYEVPEAKYLASSFCSHCGSKLPWLNKLGTAVAVPAGSLDEDPGIKPSQSIFCASRPEWYVKPDEVPEWDEYQPRKKK